MIVEYGRKLISIYKETHEYGKFVAIGIFVTHGLIDYLTTATGYLLTKGTPVEFSSVEKNPLIADANLFEMFVIIVLTSFVMSFLVILVYKANRKFEDKNLYNRMFADFLFTIILILGIALVINNIISLYSLYLLLF